LVPPAHHLLPDALFEVALSYVFVVAGALKRAKTGGCEGLKPANIHLARADDKPI
jgi:hypothetical protein